VLQAIDALREQGKCIIFSTHIMREVEKLCDRVAIIHRGKILDIGTLDELAERHQQRDMEELFFDLISKHDARRNDLLVAADANPQAAVMQPRHR
jgi:sodium transport system ATP-binding protein